MAEWKIDDKVEVTMIFFKQMDRINIIMSERQFDIMQLARAVDALECNVRFLKLKRAKKSKKKEPETVESAVALVKKKKVTAEQLYELARTRLSDSFQLLDDENMLTKTVFEGSY